LLCCISKVLEKIAYKHLHNHLHQNLLLYKLQSGFLPGHSTNHQLIELNNIERGRTISLLTAITILLLIKYGPTAKNYNITKSFTSYSLVSNYRPVVLLCCISKVLEKIVYTHLYNHLHQNLLLYKYQSGLGNVYFLRRYNIIITVFLYVT
jgi:hypothetical protein